MQTSILVASLLAICYITQVVAQPDVIDITIAVAPEGLEWNSRTNRFLFGSTSNGTIYQIDPGAPVQNVLWATHSSLKGLGIVGIHIDYAGNRVLAAVANMSSFAGVAGARPQGVAVFNLTTGALIRPIIDFVPFSRNPAGRSLANDLVVDYAGNIYVTDSYQPQFFKIDTNYQVTKFMESPLFEPDSYEIALNGIEHHPEGFLIICKSGDGRLYKVSNLGGTPVAAEVIMPERTAGCDGLFFRPTGELIVSSNQWTYTVISTDDFLNAKIFTKTMNSVDGGTTCTLQGTNIYILHSHFDRGTPPYEIERIRPAYPGEIDWELAVFQSPGIRPEGLELEDESYYAYFGSLAKGNINSAVMAFTPPLDGQVYLGFDSQSAGSAGLATLNPKRKRLPNLPITMLTAVNNISVLQGINAYPQKMIEFGYFSGAIIREIDLNPARTGRHMANELCYDDDANVYITDGVYPQIWRVNASNNAVLQFAYEPMLWDDEGGRVTLDAIVWHPDGFLIVCKQPAGRLFKVPTKGPDTGKAFEVNFTGRLPTGCEGMVFRTTGELVIAGGGNVYQVISPDGYATARVLRTVFMNANPLVGPSGIISIWDTGMRYWTMNAHYENPQRRLYELVLVPAPLRSEVYDLWAPDMVSFLAPNLHPEGIAVIRATSDSPIFYITSAGAGGVFQLDYVGQNDIRKQPNQRTPQRLFINHEPVYGNRGTFGIDLIYFGAPTYEARLWVTINDASALFGNTSAGPQQLMKAGLLGVTWLADFPQASDKGHFINDVAVLPDYTAYVTDSLSPWIFQVNGDTGVSTPYATHPGFEPPASGVGIDAVGLNGIAAHPAGFLLTVHTNTGKLFKVPLTTGAVVVTEVTLDLPLYGGDGLELYDNNTIVVVGLDGVYRVTTTDDWVTAIRTKTVSTQDTGATTATIVKGEVHTVHAHLEAFGTGREYFTITRVNFSEPATDCSICNGRAATCQPSTGRCFDCRDGTLGSRCELCPAGLGGGSCTQCPTGRYNPGAQASCSLCPTNSGTSAPGANAVTNCTCNAGSTGIAGGPCNLCEAGKYGGGGNAPCNLCAAGKYGGGGNVCNDCPLNSASPAGATSRQQCACITGYTANAAGECVSPVSPATRAQMSFSKLLFAIAILALLHLL